MIIGLVKTCVQVSRISFDKVQYPFNKIEKKFLVSGHLLGYLYSRILGLNGESIQTISSVNQSESRNSIAGVLHLQ